MYVKYDTQIIIYTIVIIFYCFINKKLLLQIYCERDMYSIKEFFELLLTLYIDILYKYTFFKC